MGATTTHFALDGAGGLPEVISTTNGTAYLHLPGVIVAQNAAGERVYLLSDGLGSVRQVISGTTVISQHDFDPYGNPTSSPQLPTPYGFAGEVKGWRFGQETRNGPIQTRQQAADWLRREVYDPSRTR